MTLDVDIAVIGAGPAGSVAATMLADRGLSVLVLEGAQFPRFSIGESLLPQVTQCLQTAGLLDRVSEFGFQYKDGAFFVCGDQREIISFQQKSASGPFHAWEVKRADFDYILAREAEARGADIRYRTRVLTWDQQDGITTLGCRTDDQTNGEEFTVSCRFLVDASGFGRVMSRLAGLERPSDLPPRRAVFRHVRHRIASSEFDPDKITIAQSRMHLPYWFWFIPFSDGTASLGLVADADAKTEGDPDSILSRHLATVPLLRDWLIDAEPLTDTRTVTGYSCNVTSLFGHRFVLLGNAAEFVDPIFSSGVSIACRSALLAAPLIERELNGGSVDWVTEYERPMRSGVRVFRTFVQAWYEGTLPQLIYTKFKDKRYNSYICSILAGYVWDDSNPFTRSSVENLRTLAKIAGS